MASIAALAEAAFCYLTTRGRPSGTPHRIEIWFVAHDDGAYLLSDGTAADWYRNLVRDPNVTLEIADERRDTTARPVAATDPSNGVVRPAMVAKYQSGSDDDLVAWSQRAALVRVEWPPAH
jgi:deazaflavin-dependent oxidoreductase (nitroreductase family)